MARETQSSPPSLHCGSRILQLKNGRRIALAEYGDPAGRPAFYFHGWPSSRLEARPADSISREMGVRMLALDRPGFGLSDLQPGRKLEDWPNDVREVADQLGLDMFTVIGNSGGAPYAAACAALIPERVIEGLILCGLGRIDLKGCTRQMRPAMRFMVRLARGMPGAAMVLARCFFAGMTSRNADYFPERMRAQLPECDRVALGQSEWRNSLSDSIREAFRNGVEGVCREGCLYAQAWNFSPEKIKVPVSLWHGEQDRIVPVEMGRYYARVIPGCHARFYPDEGHFSLPFNRMREIYETVCR